MPSEVWTVVGAHKTSQLGVLSAVMTGNAETGGPSTNTNTGSAKRISTDCGGHRHANTVKNIVFGHDQQYYNRGCLGQHYQP